MTVDVYEAESDFTEIGAGITLWDRPRSILYELGLEDELKPRIRKGGMKVRKSDTSQPFVFHEMDAPSTLPPFPHPTSHQLTLFSSE